MDENDIIEASDVLAVDEPTDLSSETILDTTRSERILDLVHSRAGRRRSGRRDAIVVLDEWAADGRYDIVDEIVVLAGRVRDYSEKAYELEGAFYVHLEEVDRNPNQAVNNLLTMVDETDDGAAKKGQKFLPKSAVSAIASVE